MSCAHPEGEEFSFALEPCKPIRILRKLLRERLDGNFAPEFRIPSTPHFSHPALTEKADDFVVAEFGAGLHWMNETTGGISGQSKRQFHPKWHNEPLFLNFGKVNFRQGDL